jgi:hypothetical protein
VVWLGGVEGFFNAGNDVGCAVGLDVVGLDVVGLDVLGVDIMGFNDGFVVGLVVGFVVGLDDVGLDVVGLDDVGLDDVGLFVSSIMLVHHLPLQPISQLTLFTLHHSPP